MNRHVTNAYFKPVKPFVTAPETLQECPCIHRFRWRTFWAFFCVNFDLMHSKNWTPIKLETCNVNVLCQLWVKYCIIQEFIVERNVAIKLKDRSFPDCLYEELTLEACPSILYTSCTLLQLFVVFRVKKIRGREVIFLFNFGWFFNVFFQDAQVPGVRSLGRINFVWRRQCLCVLSMNRASCHPSGGRNFEVASSFLKTLCPHVLRN